MNWYVTVMKKYATIRGRARRKEYWMFALFQFIFAIVAMMLDNALSLNIGALPYGYIYFAYGMLTLIPGLAVGVRRLHDTNRSGWWFLIILIPIIGAIWLLVLFCLAGTPGANKYGPDPKEQSDFSSEALDSHLAN